jgi:hypothetical protein
MASFSNLYVLIHSINFDFTGVEKVDAQWETKKVEITCVESMDSAILLNALEKWSASSGKSVELIAA